MIAKATHPTQCIFGLTPDRQSPNKTPEPTTFAVTSRAIVRFTEGRARTVRQIAARAAPAKVVAHLMRSAKATPCAGNSSAPIREGIACRKSPADPVSIRQFRK